MIGDNAGGAAPVRFGNDYDDQRDAGQQLADRDGVRRQAVGLGETAAQDAYRREVLVHVQFRRAGRPEQLGFQLAQGLAGRQVAVVTGELLVRADAQVDAQLMRSLAPYGFEVTPIEELRGRVVRLSNPALPVERLTDIARMIRTGGHQASVNHITPLGPVVKGRGGPENTSAKLRYPPSYAEKTAGPPVRIAIIDTGITAEHRTDGWLQGLATADNIDPLDDLPAPNGYLDVGAGHGTFTAGIIAQVAPDAELRIYRAMDSDGIGSEAAVACAMVRAVEAGATIINLSLGVETVDGQPLVAIEVALDLIEELDPEVLVFAAAGNDGSTRPCWPAASKRVVAVGALAADLTPAPWSNRGFWVDCSAVGEGIISTYVKGVESPEFDPSPDIFGADAWAVWSGTSFVAPQVAAAVARIAQEDACTPRRALRTLYSGRRVLPDYGRVVPILAGT